MEPIPTLWVKKLAYGVATGAVSRLGLFDNWFKHYHGEPSCYDKTRAGGDSPFIYKDNDQRLAVLMNGGRSVENQPCGSVGQLSRAASASKSNSSAVSDIKEASKS
eukprot:829491_1